MPESRTVTIVHLSDLQFGARHRFKLPRELDAVDDLDTLEHRLQEDLAFLLEEYELRPDLMIVSGDLAEWGRPSEFEDVLQFLLGVGKSIPLSRERILVVPGNHDVNRASCEAYFKQCEASELEPSRPFWPKWSHYSSFFDKLHAASKADYRFDEEEPWSLFELAELKVAVAGLNSTMHESHRDEDHHGFLGEAQLKWFRERLGKLRDGGWLRIGAMHHNHFRGPKNDDHSLQDADALKRLLGNRLNLILHGHTHETDTAWVHPKLPVLATGSAGVVAEERAQESPNQYQVLRVHPDRVERWCRRFDPKDARWIDDNRVSQDGDTGYTSEAVAFDGVQATFPEAEPRKSEHSSRKSRGENQERDTFAHQVAEVCRVRHPGSEVELRWHDEPRLCYLRVLHGDDAFARLYPIGIFEHGLTREDVDRFRSHVDARYRRNHPRLESELVYGGDRRAANDVLRYAESQQIRVFSFVEYLGILDFSTYVEKQTQKLERDPIYPPALYVPQRLSVRGSGWRAGFEPSEAHALETIEGWLRSPEARFVVLLGTAGAGKTFILRNLARMLAADPRAPAPILIEMRDLQKARSLDELVVQQLTAGGMDRWDRKAFRYMLEQGQVALLFDGYDELEVRTTYERATEHFDTLMQAALGRAKVVVTSRTEHFLTDAQAEKALMAKVDNLPGLRLAKVEEFDERQILSFLRNHPATREDPEGWMTLLDEVKDLLGLSHNPRFLSFIVELPREELEQARDREGRIDSADLYRILVERWIAHNVEKKQPRGALPSVSKDQCWRAVGHLARELWRRTEKSVHGDELGAEVERAIGELLEGRIGAAEAAQAVGSGTLLVRDPQGNFSFIHQSVLEWLVAREAAAELEQERRPEALEEQALSTLMADFFVGIAGREAAIVWARQRLGDAVGGIGEKNALLVLKQAGVEAETGVVLRGRDLRNVDLAPVVLAGADLSECDLSGVSLRERDLRGANLAGAKLVGADLFASDLRDTDLTGAVLNTASLLRADLRGSRLTNAHLRRAKLLGAKLDSEGLGPVDSFGAALDGMKALPLTSSPPSSCQAVAWSRDEGLLATGHADNSVRVWDAETGEELRRMEGHAGRVWAVAFSPDGARVASGAADESVRVWDAETGEELRRMEGHTDWVRCLAFSPDGARVASGADDGSVRVWDAETGEELRRMEGHADEVNGVAFSPDGARVASGADDRSVRVWDAATGECLAILTVYREGWSAHTPAGRYKLGGNVGAGFGLVVGLCRFAPGELEDVLETPLRVPDGEPLVG